MDLELKDYERTVEELNEVISSKENDIAGLKEDLKAEMTKTANLNDQNVFLSSQIETETERADKLKVLYQKKKYGL